MPRPHLSKYILFFLLLTPLQLFAGNYYIKGRINNMERAVDWHPVIYLSEMKDINCFTSYDAKWVIDSAFINKDGSFEFNNASPIDANTFYRLEIRRKEYDNSFNPGNYILLLLQPNSQIKLETEISNFHTALKPVKMDGTNLQLQKVYKSGQETTLYQPDDPYAALYLASVTHPDSLYALYMLQQLQKQLPRSKYTVQFKRRINELYYTLPNGAIAPEIILPDTKGDSQKLSAFRGKYVLVDFWASWCIPCRAENKEVFQPLYEQYKSKGFEIFSVSMDQDAAKWKEAIAANNIKWTQVTDLEGFYSPAAITYRINAVPTTYIISPEGKVLAKDLRGKQLEDFIIKRLNK